jgi:O-antigen ligase
VWFTVPQLFGSLDRALSGRVDSWRTVIELLAGNPWLLFTGVGYKTLPYSEVAGRQLIVDNMYLSLLAETGVIGLACFLALNFAVLRTAWRARRSFHGMWLFSFWVGQVLQMMSGDLFTYWRVIPVYFWVTGQADRVNRSEHPLR